jgi:biotin carboxyl carrier protein
MFEYDAFLSFSAKDIGFVKPVWQRLMASGLRVFWSDEDLKATAGKSFVSTIQHALVSSRDFVLCWTEHARNSPWVEEEYQAFYGQCYVPAKASRRLLIFSPDTSHFATLPPLLRQLQALTSIEQLVAALDGMDIDRLRNENTRLRALMVEMTAEMEKLKKGQGVAAAPSERQEPVARWSLSVVERSGRAHDLKNVAINYPGGNGPINERRGIRVRNGDAESLLKWSDIAKMELKAFARIFDVVMPQMGESITEGTVSKWILKLGDAVDRDAPLLEISTDKVDAEIPSPATGRITEILASEGDTVPVNTVVAKIAEERRDGPATAKYCYFADVTLHSGRMLWLMLADDWSLETGGSGLLLGDSELGETSIRFSNIRTITPPRLSAGS